MKKIIVASIGLLFFFYKTNFNYKLYIRDKKVDREELPYPNKSLFSKEIVKMKKCNQ